ncbi:type VII secretion protein EccB [Actinoplanes oblitus]|uniref:Type VII secretion protein EccB n=1 Tax=Actinoplanes oblitus TaxID=3040509 RepID=A0ABY8WJE5_9ACTN|nr:type VII secretion protein EccB [Actinoplanes oblitus]WIM98001.1 type VII secretion protein EccB [Actinoplanes oblitus]
MASRRDQLQSYQFLNQRVISAFVMRETDPAQSPLRRGIGALFGGLMVAILIAAGFGIYGILTKVGTDAWQADGSVVVERESGASFVYLQGRLNPALNFTSAKLAAGRPNPAVYRVAAKALAGTPRGITIGIPNAPASLPEAGQQIGLPWTMCAVPGEQPSAALLVGQAGPAGTPLGDSGLLVTDGTDRDAQLVWHGFKHRIDDAQTTLPALFGAVDVNEVSTAWLNAVPAGAAIEPIQVRNRGARSDRVTGFNNGQVLTVETGVGKQYYLILENGVLPITALQQAVLKARFPAEPRTVDISVLSPFFPELKQNNGPAEAQPPADPPKLVTITAGTTACAITRAADKAPAITYDGPATGLASAVPTAGSTAGGRALADAVLVPAGRFALVKVPGSGGYQVVTDLGVRHPVPGADALSRLGYAATSATEVPTALVTSIPAGVTLDPAAAVKPVSTVN